MSKVFQRNKDFKLSTISVLGFETVQVAPLMSKLVVNTCQIFQILTVLAFRIKKLLKIAEGKLGYIKMITPRTPEGQEGRTKMYFDRDGVHIGGKSIPGRTLRAGLDADDLARHKYLLERQHFMHRK